MELVLNFDKKEMVVKEAANLKELYDRLEKLLGKELKSWTVVSDVVYRITHGGIISPIKRIRGTNGYRLQEPLLQERIVFLITVLLTM